MVEEQIITPISGFKAAVGQASLVVLSFICFNVTYFESVGLFLFIFSMLLFRGYFSVTHGQAKVLVLLGAYKGSVTEAGFYWHHPLAQRKVVSLRTKVFESEKLRIYDKRGIPVDVSASVVWKASNTAKALFEVDDLLKMVEVQTHIILRTLTETYPFDTTGEDKGTITLRGNVKALAGVLQNQLNEQLQVAGIVVQEAKIKHLSYAPEVAGEMLKVYQQQATLTARKQQALAAVDMTEMVLQKAESRNMLQLSEPERSKAVADLLVSLTKELN